ncbi:MAG: methyltransferase domain-containing protein [Elusimicrobiota bacterium]
MSIYACRVCGNAFFEKPLLHYENMPSAAQNFPDAASLTEEAGAGLTVCQCSGCGLVQLDNEPVPYYKEVIRAAAVSAVIKDIKTRQLAGFIRKYSLQGKKIIEVGCGRGEFLELLRTLDVAACGLEYSESAAAHCVKNGLKVSRGYPDSGTGTLAGGPFDAFLLLMFLEHMPDPDSALKAIRDNLTDGAVGLVEVPNFDMMLRNKLFSEFIGDHLLYFSRETLRTTLNLNGFEVIECGELRDGYVISAVVRKRGKLDISGFYDQQTRIAAGINEYIGRFGEKKVAIWGAGHQALAIIALAKIQDKIRYVVDAAPFKQGKYTPATHLPVVAPETLRADPVEAVIVMAASYSDEVVGILRREFSPAMKLAILRDFGREMIGP